MIYRFFFAFAVLFLAAGGLARRADAAAFFGGRDRAAFAAGLAAGLAGRTGTGAADATCFFPSESARAKSARGGSTRMGSGRG